jgi:methylmalonyl-CoA/ethylmalonyl-CoA epimerase
VAVTGVNHVGLAVDDLDEAVATYERLFGAAIEARAEGGGLRGVMLQVGGDLIELLASEDEETPIGKFLARRGPGMHHIAFSSSDIRADLAALSSNGVELIDAEPRLGLFAHEIAFAQPDAVHGVLTELVAK